MWGNVQANKNAPTGHQLSVCMFGLHPRVNSPPHFRIVFLLSSPLCWLQSRSSVELLSRPARVLNMEFAGFLRGTWVPAIFLLPAALVVFVVGKLVYNLWFHPLRNYPGPFLARATRLYHAYYDIKLVLFPYCNSQSQDGAPNGKDFRSSFRNPKTTLNTEKQGYRASFP